MRKKLLGPLSAGLAIAVLTAGCGSGGDAGDDGSVTLQMVESLTNPVRTELLRGLLDDFEAEHPDIKVGLVSPPTEQADQKIQQMLQAGSGVDVLEVRDTTAGPFPTTAWIADKSSERADWDGWDALTENARTVAQGDGKTYYVPYGFYGTSVFYRTDLGEEAGFDGPPTTWEELLEQASAIQDPDANTYGYAFRGGANGFNNLTQVISAYVADDLDVENAYQLTSGETIFSAPEALEAAELYFELFEQAAPPSSVAWGYPEMVEGFSNGSTAFLLQDPEVIATVRESTAITEEQWTTAPLLQGPTGKAIQPLGTAGWGTAESSEHKAEAAELIEFLSEGEASLAFTEGNSLIPILQGADESEFYRTGPWESYLTMNEDPETYVTAKQPRGAAWWTEWSEKADSEIQSVLVGDLEPADMLAGWDEYWTEKLASQ